MEAIIYHNPKCSKSRATLQILKEKGIAPRVVHYLENPPSEKELAEIAGKLQIEPKQLIRFKESRAGELNLSAADNRPAGEWFSLLIDNPILMERPIVILSGKVAMGRPPENILNILG
jgi:arsenate reductase